MESKLKIAIVTFLFFIALYTPIFAPKKVKEPVSATSTPVMVATSSPSKPKSAVYDETVRVAIKYHLDQESFSKVIFCESGYNPNAWNKEDPYGGSRGVGQFIQSTFDHYSKLAGIEHGDVWNYKDAIETVGYMWSIGEQSQWSVYRILYGDMQYMTDFKKECDRSYSNFLAGMLYSINE